MVESIYRTAAIVKVDAAPKNVYKYFVLNSNICPVCNINIREYSDKRNLSNQSRRGITKYCHPLKRIVVKGRWFWKKYCPVERIHDHVTCEICNVSWIYFSDRDFEPNYQERII